MNRKGVLSGLYPMTKLTVVFFVCLSAFIAGDFRFGYFVVFPCLLILALLEGQFVPYAKKLVSAIVIMFLFIFLIKACLVPSETVLWRWGILKIYEQGLADALSLTSIILVAGGTILLFFETTDIEDFMISLQKVGISHIGSYVFLSTLQMIPDFIKKSKTIMQAQRARGIETEGNLLVRLKAFLPTLTPLIISSIADIEDKVITMEARAFSVEVKKTHLKEINMASRDKIVIGLAILGFVLFLIWRFIL